MDPVSLFIVEDQAPVLRSLVKALGGFPELVIAGTARDGAQALSAIGKAAPDLVLLDLELPGLDGIGVIRGLKAAGSAAEILILTSFDDEQKVYEAIQAGASGYLVKRVGP